MDGGSYCAGSQHASFSSNSLGVAVVSETNGGASLPDSDAFSNFKSDTSGQLSFQERVSAASLGFLGESRCYGSQHASNSSGVAASLPDSDAFSNFTSDTSRQLSLQERVSAASLGFLGEPRCSGSQQASYDSFNDVDPPENGAGSPVSPSVCNFMEGVGAARLGGCKPGG